MSKKLELPEIEICKKYLNGISTTKLAEEYECSTPTIRTRLRDNGIEIRSLSDAHKGLKIGKNNPLYVILPIDTICRKYLNGMTTVELAKEYECSPQTITKRLLDNNIIIRLLSGMKHTLESRQHMSAGRQDILYEDWKHFSKPGGYCNLFNLSLKESVRLYFNNECFMDNESEDNGRALSIHHVNFDKRCGCDPTQFCIFIPVKAKWNTKFNGSKDKNRWYWYSFLMNKIFIEHPNYFSYHIPVWGMDELEYNYDYVFERFRRR